MIENTKANAASLPTQWCRDGVMKALSIRQPWAWLLANGYKTVENRRWSTRYRGRFLVHAASTPDTDFLDRLAGPLADIELPGVLDYGGIVGVATLVDCVTCSESPWFCGPFGFVVVEAAPLPFVPMAGKLGLFNVEGGGAEVWTDLTALTPHGVRALPNGW